MRKIKLKLLQIVQKVKIAILSILAELTLLIYAPLVYASSTGANSIDTSVMITGTKKLIEDSTKAVVILAPIATILVVGYCFIRQGAADEMDHKKWANRIKVALVCGVGAVIASVIVNTIMKYYSS